MIIPDYSDFKRLSTQGNLIPMFVEIPGDLNTPVSAFMKIDDGKSSFLLESVEGGERWARYSCLGSGPRMIIRSRNGRNEIIENGQVRDSGLPGDPTLNVKEVLSRFRPVKVEGLPDFFGGAVGFLGYDVVRHFENLPDMGKPDPGFHDALFMITRDMALFDNFGHRSFLITTISLEEHSSVENAYAEGLNRLRNLKERLDGPLPRSIHGQDSSNGQVFTSNMSEEKFHEMVVQAKVHITAGDIIQVVSVAEIPR